MWIVLDTGVDNFSAGSFSGVTMEERKIALEAGVFRTISFGGFDASQIPNKQLEIAACQAFVASVQIDPTPLALGCTLCEQQGQHSPTKNVYITYLGILAPSGGVDLVLALTLLCNQHAQDAIRPSIPFRDTGFELSAWEMQTLQEFVKSELVMPNAMWVVEIEFGDARTSDDLVTLIIDASKK